LESSDVGALLVERVLVLRARPAQVGGARRMKLGVCDRISSVYARTTKPA